MKKIIILGANELQDRLVEKANNLGYETHVFAFVEGAVAKKRANFFYPISIIEKEEILKIAKELKIDAVCTVATDIGMPTVNYIAKELDLVGNSLEATERTTNKLKMRDRLSEKGLPCPWYKVIKEKEDLDIKELNFPMIVKPIDRSGSRGINKVEKEEELEAAIKNSKQVSFLDDVLIEEYIEGKEYSIETISQNGKHQILQITEKFTTGSPNFIELGHLQPARISNESKTKVIEIIIASLEALGIVNGASHSEVKINDGKIKIIEIAGRMGGDFIGQDMVKLSTGIDFLKLTLDVALGNKLEKNIKPSLDDNSVVKFIFDEIDLMNFRRVEKKYPETVVRSNINSKFNEVIKDSTTRNGYYILKIKDKNKLEGILRIINLND
ncbi:MAG: ATP-grasp domain-containing protein [Psychrilyobacter sp.]|uniref:ATP-grasp domain-containing protein n=1 Tax=Psychrilyobacter sp. TaxID=2586924 RepID=UPI003C784239